MSDVLTALGIDPSPPMVGFVWRQPVEEHSGKIAGFFRAVDEAQELLLHSDEAWRRLRPLMRVERPEEFAALRERYRAGIAEPWQAAHQDAARTLFELLRETGGEQLVGAGTRFDPQLFASGEGTR